MTVIAIHFKELSEP